MKYRRNISRKYNALVKYNPLRENKKINIYKELKKIT